MDPAQTPQPAQTPTPSSLRQPAADPRQRLPAKELSKTGKLLLDKIEFDDNETLIREIQKHPFGLAMIYFVGFIIAIIMGVAFTVISSLLGGETFQGGDDLSQARTLLLVLGFILAGFAIAGAFIAGYVYSSNIILVTNEKLAQILSHSLFNRKISQLSIGDIQDVTVRQDGIFSHMFNYGTLVIETAGEQQNYTFTFAPKPYECAKAIVGAHEENLKLYGN